MNIFSDKCPFCGKKKELDTTASAYMPKLTYKPCKCEIEEDKRRQAEQAAKLDKGKQIYCNMLVKASGVIGRFSKYRLDDITGQDEQRDLAKKYVESFSHGEKVGDLIISGPVGTGKTMLATAIIRAICENANVTDDTAKKCIEGQLERIYSPYLFIRTIDLLTSARTDMLATDCKTVQRCKSAKLLVIDDIGTVEKLSEFQSNVFFDIIDSRYTEEKPTIVTTNFHSRKELINLLGERCYDRLKDGATPIVMQGTSHRKERTKTK